MINSTHGLYASLVHVLWYRSSDGVPSSAHPLL